MSGLTAISFLPELSEKKCVLSTSERCPPHRELSDRETWEIQLGAGITIPLKEVSALLLYSACLIARPVHALECIMDNQGNMVGNSKVFEQVQNDPKY